MVPECNDDFVGQGLLLIGHPPSVCERVRGFVDVCWASVLQGGKWRSLRLEKLFLKSCANAFPVGYTRGDRESTLGFEAAFKAETTHGEASSRGSKAIPGLLAVVSRSE